MNYILSIILNIIYLLPLNLILCDLLTDYKLFIGESEFNYVSILCVLIFVIIRINDLNIFIENSIVILVLRVILIFLLVFYLIQGINVTNSEYENIITIWEFTFAREPSEQELDCFIKEKLKECKMPKDWEFSSLCVEKLIANSSNEHGIVSLKMLSDNIEELVTRVHNNIEKLESDEFYSKIYDYLDKRIVHSTAFMVFLLYGHCAVFLEYHAFLIAAYHIDKFISIDY